MPAAPLPSLQGWVPIMASLRAGTLETELCRVGARRFREPFFEDSIAACLQLPFNSVFRHRLDTQTLTRWLQDHPGLPPSGFIFHMSRCGSTLMSQLLATSPAHRVISEAGPIDAALRATDGTTEVSDATRIAWLQTMVGLLGQPGRREEQRLFVKFDSWHTPLLPLIAQAFPGVPWIFVVRDPVDVIVSHLRRPGAQMVPGMLGFGPPGVDTREAASLPREEYCARMLGGLCEAAERHLTADPLYGLVVDYGALPGAVDALVLPHLAWCPDTADREEMAVVWRKDAKNPAFAFAPDSQAKRREATEAVHRAAERWVVPVYQRLLATAGARRTPDAQRQAACAR